MGEEFSYLIHIPFFSVKLRMNSAGELYKRVMLKWEMGQDGVEMEFTVGSMVIICHTSLPSLNCSVWFWYSGRYQATLSLLNLKPLSRVLTLMSCSQWQQCALMLHEYCRRSQRLCWPSDQLPKYVTHFSSMASPVC